MPRLRRIDCSGPGMTRRRRGRGFQYLDSHGDTVTDAEALARIHELAIPPAWTDVWICSDPNGHLQATGTDAAGRKQYLYHRRWRERRDQAKFDEMIDFARDLPKMRATIAEHIAGDDLGRERVLACAARLLDQGFFRIGTEQYATDNGSFGLATMLKEHVSISDDALVFNYPAKSGIRQVQEVVDPEALEIVTALKRRRGGSDELLAYKENRRWRDVKSPEINAYLREISGGEYSAKDFRTWNATVMAALALAVSAHVATGSPTARKRAITRATKEVASYLGNTPAVCRASYIDPRVFDRFLSGWTIVGVLKKAGDPTDPDERHAIEDAVVDLLEGDRSSDALEKGLAA